ncbi:MULTISPECIES: non-homologous end-joining DNA ligase [Streptomyces]|uniref:Bifunctional non-homologous end joining protein LigD n=1 Tax=Streptomyces clavifer TaxID=68188 RepID=A0ABS4V5H5_9ACTN|nr:MULTISPECIES: non-homologous end-joining DNA ligase [Streptomyces]MBP2359087.1 bifunctional non-homologous end joining protein LigD [Streptomyces clavifer]MDX2745763.1 non-homologous end-joining DNA ligase [Streptomyces sp. NRRL_B-2557]MDX3067230.1 non-homologous end-joining DNA ligase [Streptomyces sp. ND04-05B]WRY84165.1 non-homologous end-joining DNA ligase [Streptomyces clavifer]GHA82623.1 ATP-dependent DNA ligase [Streptomyces clavifer]
MTPITVVEGRRLALSNLDKVLYPATGTTKGEVLHYYAATAADVMLAHLRDRPLSFLRYPDGPEGLRFFTKNPPPGTPDWVRTAPVPRRDEPEARQVLVQDLPSLMWAANLVVEFHTHQWRQDTPAVADRLVFDLDPGPPASIVECCAVALWLRERLAADGLSAYGKTSGSKGLHLLVPLEPSPSDDVTAYAKALAVEAHGAQPELAVYRMTRALRPGKVFVDFSQNAAAKTTAAPYTLRAKGSPAVSAPVTWDEIEACGAPSELVFLAGDMEGRIAAHGDLLAPLNDPRRAHPLPAG